MSPCLKLVAVVIGVLACRCDAQSQITASASAGSQSVQIATFVAEAARRFAIPEAWIFAVMRVESGGNSRAVSPKGATGLMQLMPSTWALLRARYGLGGDIYDPRDNIIAGAGYLRELYDRYGSPGFLAAYNAGPLRYEDYLRGRQSLPAETTSYVNRLAPALADKRSSDGFALRRDPNAWTHAGLFITRLVGESETSEVEPVSRSRAADPRRAEPRSGQRDSLFPPLSGHPAR